MKVEVLMPKLGLTMTTGTVTKWFKNEGDRVEAGEPLFELMTDKITHVAEAPGPGVLLQKVVAEGEEVEVGKVVGYIGDAGEPDLGSGAGKAQAGKVQKMSPRARKLAAEKGVDAGLIQGTGPDGRITEEDVERFIGLRGPAREQSAPGLPQVGEAEPEPKRPRNVRPLSTMRKTIGDRLSSSMLSAPHIYLAVEVDASGLKAVRDRLAVGSGGKTSYNALITKAVGLALREFPVVNSSLVEDKVYEWEDINVGLAVALDEGLVVPVVKNADEKDVARLNEEIGNLVAKAREGRLEPEDVAGGTFTVSNLGGYGVDSFTAIINPPESAILAVGAIREAVCATGGKVEIRPVMKMTLSADHRLIDGAVAAAFLKRVKSDLERPERLL